MMNETSRIWIAGMNAIAESVWAITRCIGSACAIAIQASKRKPSKATGNVSDRDHHGVSQYKRHFALHFDSSAQYGGCFDPSGLSCCNTRPHRILSVCTHSAGLCLSAVDFHLGRTPDCGSGFLVASEDRATTGPKLENSALRHFLERVRRQR